MKKINKKTIFVGMSGGVDSSVSAALLKEQGYDVVGVFIRTWHPEYLPCNEEEERMDAMRVCAHLDISFLTFNFEDIYKKEVADYMISEYKLGRTPNPDVMCNKYVKFGAFLDKAMSMGADYVATGHYAQVKTESFFSSGPRFSSQILSSKVEARPDHSEKNFQFLLKKGIDPSKDQCYFLWTLRQEQLSKIIFPVGNLEKSEVRKLAKKFKLPVAEKKDSQGICFLGMIDLKDFLKHYIKEKKGNVVIVPSKGEGEGKNKVIGHHDGVVFFTLGERHGFTITKKNPNDGAYYVVGKDVKKNILYVSQDKNLKDSKYIGRSFVLKDTNWISEIPKETKSYTCQIRYHGEFLKCQIISTSPTCGDRIVKVIFEKQISVASGQSVVVYDKNVCLGGGIVI